MFHDFHMLDKRKKVLLDLHLKMSSIIAIQSYPSKQVFFSPPLLDAVLDIDLWFSPAALIRHFSLTSNFIYWMLLQPQGHL